MPPWALERAQQGRSLSCPKGSRAQNQGPDSCSVKTSRFTQSLDSLSLCFVFCTMGIKILSHQGGWQRIPEEQHTSMTLHTESIQQMSFSFHTPGLGSVDHSQSACCLPFPSFPGHFLSAFPGASREMSSWLLPALAQHTS